MAGIPFLHNIDLNNHQLLNAKLHTSDSAPSTPGIGTIWYDSSNDLVKLYDNTATGNVSGWNTITGDITAVTSGTTPQLSVTNENGPAPEFSIELAVIANGGTALATADQIHTFVTGQTDTIAASTSGTAAIATAITVADESSDTTCFPLFATAATGNLGPKSGTNLTFNSSTGILTATGFAGPLTGNVTGNTSGTAATVTGAAQTAITSLGTLTTLTVDNVIINGTTIGHTSDTDLMSLANGALTINGNTTINTTGVTSNVVLVSTDTSASSAPDLVFYRNAGAPIDEDTLGMIEFRSRNAMGSADTSDIAYAGIYGVVTDASDQESNIGFSVNKGNGSGAFIRAALISAIGTNNSATGAMIINPSTSFSVPTHNLEVNGTADVSGTLTAGAFSGPLTGNVTGNVTGSLIIGGHTVDDIDITSEASNADDHLMTALAIKNRIEDYSYITASSTDTLSNKTITATQVTEISNLTAAEGEQLEAIGSTTISGTQWGYLGAATGAITNTNTGVDMTTTTLKTKLAGGFPSNAVTIGDSDDLVTIGNDLTVTGDLIVSGDTVTVNTATLDVEDLNITVGKAATSSSAANGAGLTFGAWSSGTIPTLTWVHASTYLAVNKNFHVTGNITLSGTVDGIDIATDVAANTAKNTNVSTNLGITGTNAARVITSSDGTNATIPVATTSVSGVMSAAQVTTLNATQTAGNVGTLIDARSSAHTITGDNSATSFTIDYGFTAAAVNDVIIQVVCSYASDTDHDGDTVYTETERHSITQCKIKFATAPATGHTYRVLCFKIA